MKFQLVSALAVLSLGPGLSSAAEEVATMDPILVTASRVAQTADETLASVTVIERTQIENRQALSVPDLLRGLAGLTVDNSGGPGKATSMFLRGSNSGHVLVLIDGVKVGSATLGTAAFEHLPVEQIERIEIVRGPRSSLYGSEAIGGVIQIFTRRGGGTLTPSFSLGGGSYNTFEGSASLSGGGDNGWFNASVSGVETDGFNACNGEPWVAGCFTHEPDKDGYRNLSGSLYAGYRFDNGVQLDAHWLRSGGDTDFDGEFQNESEFVQQVMGAGIRLSPTDIWDLSLNVGRSTDDSDNYKNGVFSSRFETQRDSVSLQNNFQVAPDHLVTLGLDYQKDKVGGTTDYVVDSRYDYGLFGQYLGRFGGHDIQASLRGDDNEQFGGQTTGSLAWGYELGGGMRLIASYGTAFKAPNFNELYYPGFGNPNLRPEESGSFELGLSGKTGWGIWSVNAYQTDLDDLIAFDADTYAPANIDTARIRGLEAVVNARFSGWDLAANLTLLQPLNRSGGPDQDNLLPRRPEQSLRVDLDRSLGRFGLGATLLAVGRSYDNIANTRELEAYATVDLRAEYRFAPAWRIQARVDNLFDEEYETAAFYNQPGRSLYLTLRYEP